MDILKYLSDFWDILSNKIVEVLPKSPIVYLQYDAEFKSLLGYVNWFIPIYTMISLTEAWLTAIAIYYIVQVILRWVKVVE